MISFVLSVIKVLTEVHKFFIDPFLMPLTRVLQRLARDMGSSAASHVRQGQRMDADAAVSSSRPVADVGSVTPNLKSILKLISGRVMYATDSKKLISQQLTVFLMERGTDASMLLCILDIVKSWVEDDFSRPTASSTSVLAPKEIVHFLQKLSQVDKQNFSASSQEEWDSKYLQLLYGVCADSN
ncbi:hypothetical protein MKW94_015280, partial [Papaver nudicaule]|nr:hypothetical protein [Papaver nudicaule]